MRDDGTNSSRRQRRAARLDELRERIRARATDQVYRHPARAPGIVTEMIARLEERDAGRGR